MCENYFSKKCNSFLLSVFPLEKHFSFKPNCVKSLISVTPIHCLMALIIEESL